MDTADDMKRLPENENLAHKPGPGPNRYRSRAARLTHLLLKDEPRYNQRDAARLAGVTFERATDLWRSLGFAVPPADEIFFTNSDIEALRIASGLQDTGVILELPLARALGQSMARMTEWQASMLTSLAKTGGVNGETVHSSTPIEAATAVLLPAWERVQQHIWLRHLIASLERDLRHDDPTSERTVLVVGFADLADYTSTSRGLTGRRLTDFIETFESTSSLVVTDHGGRVVKTIGDEIMFVVEDVLAAADIALTLASRISELDGRADLHVGLAYGPVLRHLGDYYGTVVNLASRLAALARPGTVIVDKELARNLRNQPEFQLRELRAVALRGFPQLTPWLLRSARSLHPHVRPIRNP